MSSCGDALRNARKRSFVCTHLAAVCIRCDRVRSHIVARFIAAHSVWDIGGREVATRYGEMDGTGAGAVSRDDGLDFSYAFNRRVTTADHDFIKGKIDSFLNAHGASL